MKTLIKHIPLIGPLFHSFHKRFLSQDPPFVNSANYWESRYRRGGDSGIGSYGHLADFKATFLNDFVLTNDICSVIEYGCGDGNQLSLASYPRYLGFDVSDHIIKRCISKFRNDNTKAFKLASDYANEKGELTLSLDVIYHLVEDSVFENYMNRLFDSSTKYVIIYSSDFDSSDSSTAQHVRHRRFTPWICKNKPDWRLVEQRENIYKFNESVKIGSVADFFVYAKASE
jgi:hypothetical protein